MSDLALFGGDPVRKTPYPGWPVFDERDIAMVTQIIKSGNWGGFPYPGPQTAAFIRKFLDLQGGAVCRRHGEWHRHAGGGMPGSRTWVGG